LQKEQTMPGHDNNEPIELSDDELDAVVGGRQEQQQQTKPTETIGFASYFRSLFGPVEGWPHD
jgi:hypothetical protein